MFSALLLTAILHQPDAAPLKVRVDSARHEVILTLGPLHLPAASAAAGHEGAHAGGHEDPVLRFTWPVAGWARGFRITIHDGGRPLSRRLLHHVNLLHLGRRQFLEPAFERTIAAGQETDDVLLPSSIGVPIDAGSEMALLTAWANETGEDLHSVTLDLAVPYVAANRMPRPQEILPFDIDLGFRPGASDAFDVGPGRTVHQRDFVPPTSGRILAVGGHLHDYAESIALVDQTTGKVLFRLKAKTDSAGRLVSVARKFFGVTGDGLLIRAGRPYRIVAIYQNPLDRTLVNGGMAVLAGVIAPEASAQWPALDWNDPGFLADRANLKWLGCPPVAAPETSAACGPPARAARWSWSRLPPPPRH